MNVPPPPVSLPRFNTTRLTAGTVIVRLHDPDFEGDAFNPCKGGLTRFAPLQLPAGDCLPTLYAGDSFECAVHESIFHDVPYGATDKFIARGKVTSRAISWLEVTQDLELASLHEPDLNRLGRTRSEIIDTPPPTYADTARWAEAFHRASGTVAGLAWTSRRCDPARAFVLFEDRVEPGALEVRERVEIATSASHLDQIREFGRRAGITITL